jgi:hypothetical protein
MQEIMQSTFNLIHRITGDHVIKTSERGIDLEQAKEIIKAL